MVDEIIASRQLASKVAIHNLCNLTGQRSQPLVYLMWPTPNSGYGGSHLLKIWRKVIQHCATNNVNLVGHSVDSAGFSLAASVQLMTPTESAVAEGINYLGLDVPDEKFVAPYFWKLPSIAYGDYDHLRRTFLRVLKYSTRNLTFFKDARGSTVATINHLHELMHICKEKGQSVPFSANDLILISFFDQRPDTANRIFTLKVVDMLHKYVKGSEGTCLYITAVHFLTEPFFNASYGSPEEIQKALSTGISILRLWKRYLELKKMKLHSQKNAAKIKERRGNFITYGAYTTSELLFSAGCQHSLAMFLHFKHLGPEVCSPHRSGTITTEKIIGQLQGKTNQLQSLDTSPTYADMINKTKDLAFINEALSELSSYEGIRIPATSNRKLSHFQVRKGNDTRYQYPCNYREFLERQRSMHRAGVKQAQDFIRKYLPNEFETTLTVNGYWEMPYTFTKPADTIIVSDQPPSYDKLEVFLDVNTTNSVENEVVTENLLIENEEDEFVGQPSQLDEVDDEQQMTPAKTEKLGSDDDEDLDSEQPGDRKSKWYIERNGSLIHVKKALKLLIPREFISKERSRRHWVSNSLHSSLKPIDPSHDVIQFRDVAIADKDNFFILHILSILSEDGKELVSTSSKCRHTVRGIIYRDVESNQYGFVSSVFVSRWLPVSKVLMEVVLETDSNGLAKLSERSELDLETVLANYNHIEAGIDEITECADDKFYEVEKIIDVRLNRQYHSEEYKVRFKGYGSEDDMWLPSSSFREPVQFQTVSKRGRARKHRTKDEGEVEVQQRKKSKRSNGTTANFANSESDKRMKKDVPCGKNPLPKKKSPPTKTGKKRKSTKKNDGKNFRKSLRSQSLPDCNSSGSDLEIHFAPQRKRKCRRKTPSEKPGSEVDESGNIAGDDHGDDIEPSKTTHSSRGSWSDHSKSDGDPCQVCRGSFHQSWHEDFQCPGQQCSSITLTSLLYATVKPVESWKVSDLDQVLLTGDKVHFNQLCYIKKSPTGELKLALDELPKDLQCFRFQFFTEREILGGTIDKRDTKSDDDHFARLEDIFQKCQNEKAPGLLLRILDYTIACAQSYSKWYVIDSHARNSRGMVDDKGSSVVLKFDNFNALIQYVRYFVEAATSQRRLTIDDLTFEALVLNIKERKPAESDDVLILPVSTLLSYQNSFGSVDVHSCFTVCLEEEQEVNDDVLDFYLLHAAENRLHRDLKKMLYLYNSCFYQKLSQFNPQALLKWTKNTDIFSKKYLIIPVCDTHHWILVIVKTDPNMKLMIFDSLQMQHKIVERKIVRYLKDVWSARPSQGGRKDLEVEQVRYPTVPRQPNDKDCGLYVMKCFEQFLEFVNRDLQWSTWNPNFSHRDIVSLRKIVKNTIMDEVSTKC